MRQASAPPWAALHIPDAPASEGLAQSCYRGAVEILVRGTPLDTDDVQAPGARPGSPIIIERGLGECPHGFWYQARQDEVPLLVTVLDPILVAQPDLRAQLARDIERGRNVSHRNLLPCYGFGTAGLRSFTAEAWPGGGTVREFARGRRDHGHALDLESAYTLVAHVCNGLVALHEQLVHGYVTADTVHVSEEGRVLLGAIGIGASLPRTRGFSRFRFGGLLPNVAPEQVVSPPRMTMATDVFGVAALFLELITGQSLVEAGQPLRDLGFRGSETLADCLERATDPDPALRQPDVAELKAELAAALRAEGLTTSTRPPGELDEGLRASLAKALGTPVVEADVEDVDDWSDLGVPENAAPVALPGAPRLGTLEIGVPGDPTDGGGEAGIPAPPGYAYAPDPGAAGYPYPPPADPGAAPPGYPYPPPGYPYPPPGAYPPPPPGYPYPPPGYPYPPPGAYPPAAYPYPYPPPGYPYPPGGAYPGGAYPPGYGAPGQPAGTPGRITPPPRPAMGFDPEAARRQMDELDRATRRIAGIDADAAVREYTEHVGDGESRFDVDDDGDPAAQSDDSGSVSLLGLEVEVYEDAAQRLATLDGVEDTETTRKAAGPSEDGTFFGSFSDEPARKAEPEDDAEARWSVVRDGKDYGPYSIASLGQMIRSGRVRSVDTLRREGSGREAMAVDVPALRPACEERRNADDKQPRSRVAEERLPSRAPASPAQAASPAAAPSPAPAPRGRSPWLVMAIVAVIVSGLGIAGFLLTRGT